MSKSAKKGEPEKMHMLIDGYVYDVTKFIKRHPGGSVLRFYKNMDATDVFHALHATSDKATKWLKNIPRVKASESSVKIEDDAKDPLIKDFRELRTQMKKDGLYKPLWSMQVLRLAEVVFWHVLSLFVAVNYNVFWGGVLYGFNIGRNGLLMHDMGHRAFFSNMWWDKLAHFILFGMGVTGSASHWTNQHNKHHAATQELKHDTDLFTLPVVAFNREVAKYGNPNWLRYQWLTFLPAQLGLFVYWKITHTRHVIRTKRWTELSFMLSHELIYLAIYLATGFPLWKYIIVEMMGYMFGGFYLASTFSLNHTHKPVVQPHTQRDWVRRSTEFTTNITPSPFVNWFTGYLNYQVEHHLFPTIPHPRLPEVSKRVKKLCKKHNVVYDCKDPLDAIKCTFNNIYEVGQDAYNAKVKKN